MQAARGLARSVLCDGRMRCKWLPFTVLVLAACSSASTTGNTSDASAEGASGDARGDAARANDSASGDDGAAVACPASASTSPCPVEGQRCSYGCTGCTCQSGFWYCSAPGCAGGCGGHVGPPPVEGEACGGCCGPTYGETCTFACVGDDAGTVSEICESSGWHVSSPCPALGADGGLDAQTEGG
jgi:FlaG/FlaF family flagellin (archaellin)